MEFNFSQNSISINESLENPNFGKGSSENPNCEKGIVKKEKKYIQVKRDCQLTLNNEKGIEDLLKYLKSFKHYGYIIACREKAPTTGKIHYHIYVQFKKITKLTIAKLQGAHYEICRGTPEENRDYIIKEGDIICEEGDMDHYIPKKKLSIGDIKKLSPMERDNLPAYYFNMVEKIKTKESARLTLSDFNKKVKIYYLWGESGAGKTFMAQKLIGVSNEYKEIGGFNEVKYTNSFWLGANEEDRVALYDDFRSSHLPPSEFINFIDYNTHAMNIKGGTIKNKYSLIIITSIQDPDILYEGYAMKFPEAKEQWLRRMIKIKIDPLYFKGKEEGVTHLINYIKLFIIKLIKLFKK